MCLCVKLLPIYFLLTSGWCPVKVKLRATPSFFHAKGLDRPENRQPLRRRNRPSYYKHNHAYYHAAAILVLSCSKAYICLIKVPLFVSLPALSLSLFKLPLSFFSLTLCKSTPAQAVARTTQHAKQPCQLQLQET